MTTAGEPPRDLADRIIRQTLPYPPHLRRSCGKSCRTSPTASTATARGWWTGRICCPTGGGARPICRSRFRTAPATEELRALVYVLVEHQSDTDPLLPLRMLSYAVALLGETMEGMGRAGTPTAASSAASGAADRPVHRGDAVGKQPDAGRPARRAGGVSRFRAVVATAILESVGSTRRRRCWTAAGMAATAGGNASHRGGVGGFSDGVRRGPAADAGGFRAGSGALARIDECGDYLGPMAAARRGARRLEGDRSGQPDESRPSEEGGSHGADDCGIAD